MRIAFFHLATLLRWFQWAIRSGKRRIGTKNIDLIHAGSHADDHLAEGDIVLTFDDGPSRGRTDKISLILSIYGVRATFFVVGAKVDAAPDLVRRLLDQGHSLGAHCQNHVHLAELSFADATREIENGIQSLRRALQPRSLADPFFRPPYLEDTPEIAEYLNKERIVNWNFGWLFDDWTDISVDELVRSVIARAERERKGIIILHDIWPVTCKALPPILEELDRRGFRFVQFRSGAQIEPTEFVGQASRRYDVFARAKTSPSCRNIPSPL
jgi:peptidoglycan/xylan/chitin deacetylase (PgdA/CDA1 family)